MKCMYCKKEIVEKLSFNNVFSKKDSLVLCEECKYNIDINITELAEYTLYYFLPNMGKVNVSKVKSMQD